MGEACHKQEPEARQEQAYILTCRLCGQEFGVIWTKHLPTSEICCHCEESATRDASQASGMPEEMPF